MAELLFYPILVLLLILQMAIVRHLPLFNGTADLLLLWLVSWGLQNKGKNVWIGAVFVALLISFVSAVPWYAAFASYLLVAVISRFMNRHFWQSPLIALVLVTFICSLFEYFIQLVVLIFQGIPLSMFDSIRNVIIPSVFLNLVISLPIYALVSDMARWVYPIEGEG
jgi:hypothetical protein